MKHSPLDSPETSENEANAPAKTVTRRLKYSLMAGRRGSLSFKQPSMTSGDSDQEDDLDDMAPSIWHRTSLGENGMSEARRRTLLWQRRLARACDADEAAAAAAAAQAKETAVRKSVSIRVLPPSMSSLQEATAALEYNLPQQARGEHSGNHLQVNDGRSRAGSCHSIW